MVAPLGAQETPALIAKPAAIESDQPADETPTFKTGVSDVRVDVQVTDGDKLVKDLDKSNFAVSDEGQPQPIVSFAHGDEPVNLIILLDVSGSMQKFIDQIAAEAREALDHLRPGDRVALMVFAKTTAVAQGFSDNLAETARNIGGAVKDWDVGSSTMINSAVLSAARYMEKHAGAGGRRAILILTDNLSTSYRLTDGQVIRELEKGDTVAGAACAGQGGESGLHAGECLRSGGKDGRRVGEGGERGRFVQGYGGADSQPVHAGVSRAGSAAGDIPAYHCDAG